MSHDEYDRRSALVDVWRGRAESAEQIADGYRQDGDAGYAEHLDRVAVEYRHAADEMELGLGAVLVAA